MSDKAVIEAYKSGVILKCITSDTHKGMTHIYRVLRKANYKPTRKRRVPITHPENRRIVADYLAGTPIKTLPFKHGRPLSYVYVLLKRSGIRPNRMPWPPKKSTTKERTNA